MKTRREPSYPLRLRLHHADTVAYHLTVFYLLLPYTTLTQSSAVPYLSSSVRHSGVGRVFPMPRDLTEAAHLGLSSGGDNILFAACTLVPYQLRQHKGRHTLLRLMYRKSRV